MKSTIEAKVVLVSGAGGSIGSELCRQILKYKPSELIIFDHSEYSLYKIEQELKQIIFSTSSNIILNCYLGSIQSKEVVNDLFKKHDIKTVYHAAAYKHVPLAEKNIVEVVKNNVFGTKNLVDVTLKHNVEHFTLISTDKAVRPANIMGASKRLAEIICQSADAKNKQTLYSIVRFGNVLGSSGSVIPLFKEQLKNGGPITVTDKRVTRYFMTTNEAAELVIQAASLSQGGDIFLLDMGKPIKIFDLAHRMISLQGLSVSEQTEGEDNKIKIVFTGLRPGEKMFEELFIDDDVKPTKHPRIMMSNETTLPFQEVESILKKLKIACENNEHEKVLNILINMPIGYSPQN